MADDTETTFEGWAILELMGHRRLAGYVSEANVAGAAMLRIDVPQSATEPFEEKATGPWATTQFYSPQALYCLTPTTEDIARGLAASNQPTPVHRWELPAAVGAGDDDPEDISFG